MGDCASPFLLRHGPLRVYLKPLAGCPDLQRFIETLPSGQPVIWCDSGRSHPVTGRWSLLGYDPWLTLRVTGGRCTLHTSASTRVFSAHPLDALTEVLCRYQARPSTQVQGRAIGLMGFVSYDLSRWIERLPAPQPSEQPLEEMVWFGMRVVILVDHLQQRSWLVSVVDPHGPETAARREALAALEEAEQRLHPTPAQRAPTQRFHGRVSGASAGLPALEATVTQHEFETMVSRALEYIRAGDIFQANISQRFSMPWRRPALPLYRALRRINPSPFACYLACDDLAVVSCSPERLVRVQDGRVETRPIAGTRPRGMSPAEDAVQGLELLLSEKERAEHIMLVDLERNDLGRVCTTGSVVVDELMVLEEYSHVIHIVSNVSGVLRRDARPADVIRAVFPGGTITGCPKVRCMEILRELEPVPRGLYTGSMGTLGFDGSMDLNIAIRTMVIRNDRLSFHVGAGIVADSDPEREYQETLAKAGALMEALRSSGPRSGVVHATAR